jgi:hypothetical protein
VQAGFLHLGDHVSATALSLAFAPWMPRLHAEAPRYGSKNAIQKSVPVFDLASKERLTGVADMLH